MGRFFAKPGRAAMLACLGLFVAGHAAPAAAQSRALEAMVNHPNVAEARSAICTAAGQFDRAKSQQRPQVTFSLGSNTVLTDSFKDARDGNSSNNRNTRARGTARDDSASDYKAIDGTITVTQLIYDWGLTRSDKRIALNEKAENSLSMQLQLDRIASEILDLSMQTSEHLERIALYDAYLAELEPIAGRVEASVNAGVLRIDDQRAMTIIQIDGEAARSLAQREAGIAEGELIRRFGINYDQTRDLLERFLANRPEQPPVIDSNATREVRLLDIQIRSSEHEIKKLAAERFPRLQVSSNLKLFDVDAYDNEYEVTGNFSVAMPLYDGGSNKARRNENIWHQRGLVNNRANIVRQHRNAVAANVQNIARAREGLESNIIKEAEADKRLQAARAREGVTATDPVGIARSLEQLTSIRSEQLGLRRQVETGLLSGLFFSDQLGVVLELPYGGPQC